MLSASLAVTFEVLPHIFTDWVEAMLLICPTVLRKVLNKIFCTCFFYLYTLLQKIGNYSSYSWGNYFGFVKQSVFHSRWWFVQTQLFHRRMCVYICGYLYVYIIQLLKTGQYLMFCPGTGSSNEDFFLFIEDKKATVRSWRKTYLRLQGVRMLRNVRKCHGKN